MLHSVELSILFYGVVFLDMLFIALVCITLVKTEDDTEHLSQLFNTQPSQHSFPEAKERAQYSIWMKQKSR